MVTTYVDLLREAREPPSVVIGGKTFTGRILSYEQILCHEEALHRTMETNDENTFADLTSQLEFARNFLRDVFEEPPNPDRPTEPKAQNIIEKMWYWLSGNDPKRFHDYVDALTEWEEEVREVQNNNPIELIIRHPNIWETIGELFTYHRATKEQTVATN